MIYFGFRKKKNNEINSSNSPIIVGNEADINAKTMYKLLITFIVTK